MLGIRCPISGHMQPPVHGQAACHQPGKIGLHDASLVMAFLGPRIREQQLYFVQTLLRDLVPQYLDRIMGDHPQVGDFRSARTQQQMSDSGLMDLDTQEVALRGGYGPLQ